MEPSPATEQINAKWASQLLRELLQEDMQPAEPRLTMLHSSLARGGDQSEDRSEQPSETIPAD